MAASSLLPAQVDVAVKGEAAAVLESMGLTVADAVRLMLARVAHDDALPFDPPIPGPETVEAMEEGRRGGLPSFSSVDDLMADLNADD
jgi:DNA-damage-inducible protein J